MSPLPDWMVDSGTAKAKHRPGATQSPDAVAIEAAGSQRESPFVEHRLTKPERSYCEDAEEVADHDSDDDSDSDGALLECATRRRDYMDRSCVVSHRDAWSCSGATEIARQREGQSTRW